MGSIQDTLKQRFQDALAKAFGAAYATSDPILGVATNPKFGDYQANVALALAKPLGCAPRSAAEQILAHLDVADLCETPTIAGPGFINLTLQPSYLEQWLRSVEADERLGIVPTP
ncbi:MAG: arginine--tRNA ligase, partial [Thermosynechococcaceae cyanobacterium]